MLVRFGGGVVDARGSVAGNTFTRSKGGATVRARRKPINPNSPTQFRSRAIASVVAQAWGATLTAAQRAAWNLYALNSSWLNKLGESINIGGLAAFMRLNALLILAGKALTAAGPTAYGHAEGPVSTITAAQGTQLITLAEPSVGFAKATTGDLLLIFQPMPQNIGRSAEPSRPRFIQAITGSSGAPPAFPASIAVTNGYPISTGMRVSLSLVHIDVQNRVSIRNTFFCTAT